MNGAQAALSRIVVQDHRLMRRLNRWSAPRWVRVWMIWATRGGDGWLWLSLIPPVWMLGGASAPAAIAACVTAALAGILVFLTLKRSTRRPRPCHLEPHAWSRLSPPDRFSFPSGHTITAFAIAVPLAGFYPGMSPVLALLSCSVAASRIILGMHFLSDVAAGVGIGTFLGYASLRLFA